MSTTLKFLILGDDQGSRAFDKFARSVDGASRSADKNSAALLAQSKTTAVAADAAIALAKTDKTLRDAQLELAVAAGELTRAEAEQARGAEKAAVKTRAAGEAAKGAGSNFGLLASPMGAAVVAGVALSPVAVTLAAGLGGLGLAAFGAAKDARAMHGVLSPLKAEVTDFQKSLKPQVLTLFGDGAAIAETGLKGLQPVAAATGTALHGVLGAIGANFKSGQWQQFFGFMERTAGPDVQLLGRLFIDLSNDIPPVLETLQPVAMGLLKITDAIVRIPAVLDQVKAKTGASQPGAFGGTGLDRIRQFISWGEKHIPAGNKSISDLIGLTGRAATGTAGTAAGISATGAAAAVAAPRIGTLDGDMATLNATVGSGNSVLAAYSDLWNTFVGKSVSNQQAVLNLKAAFEGYNSTVKTSGRTSTAAQQSFLSIFDIMKNGLDALHQNGASIQQLNSFYTTSIGKLNALHGLTPAQRSDAQGLTRDYLAWAGSVSGLSGNVVNASRNIRDNFLVQMGATHRLVPTARADADAFATAVYKTGTNSRATASDRQRLINDLVHSGLSAQDARARVKSFQDRIDALKGKTVAVAVTASGSGGIDVAATGLPARIWKLSHLAAGGRIPGFGGGDVHPALLEGGETVVDKHTSRQLAGVFKAAGVPGYAAGGIAGMVPFTAGQASADIGQWAGTDLQAMLNSMIAAFKATIPTGAFTPGAPATGSALAAQRFAQSILPAGWSWPALLSLWNQESGWNAYAVNPSSGAYGIPQSLGHGHPYNLGDYANQVRWGISYIAGRYGSSQAAWAHEQAFNWYGNGLDAVFRKPTVIGVGDRPGGERVQVTPAGDGGGDRYYSITVIAGPGTHPAESGKAVVKAIKEYENVNGKGWRS